MIWSANENKQSQTQKNQTCVLRSKFALWLGKMRQKGIQRVDIVKQKRQSESDGIKVEIKTVAAKYKALKIFPFQNDNVVRLLIKKQHFILAKTPHRKPRPCKDRSKLLFPYYCIKEKKINILLSTKTKPKGMSQRGVTRVIWSRCEKKHHFLHMWVL